MSSTNQLLAAACLAGPLCYGGQQYSIDYPMVHCCAPMACTHDQVYNHDYCCARSPHGCPRLRSSAASVAPATPALISLAEPA